MGRNEYGAVWGASETGRQETERDAAQLVATHLALQTEVLPPERLELAGERPGELWQDGGGELDVQRRGHERLPPAVPVPRRDAHAVVRASHQAERIVSVSRRDAKLQNRGNSESVIIL